MAAAAATATATATTRGHAIDFLVNHAGFGSNGPFLQMQSVRFQMQSVRFSPRSLVRSVVAGINRPVS